MTVKNYLEDLLRQLLDEAIEIRDDESSEYDLGVLDGYYRCITKILNLAQSFELDSMLDKELRDFKVEDLIK